MEKEPETNFFFDEFEIDANKRKLLKRGQIIHLKPKTFDVLLILVKRQGEILSKNDLLNLVWKNQFVEENNLTVHIAALRKSLGETKDEHRFIVTVPGSGYKFIADLNEINENGKIVSERREAEQRIIIEDGKAPESRSFDLTDPPPNFPDGNPLRSDFRKLGKLQLITIIFGFLIVAVIAFIYLSQSRHEIRSVAVLPLVNVGGDPKMDYLSDGITENLINDLSQSSNLKVIARSSVFRYKVGEAQSSQLDLPSIANELGVQAVLTGRVEQRGDDLFISVELVDGNNNASIWGEHYSRKFAEVFAVQEEIARDISGKLRLKLTGKEHRQIAKRYTESLKAFENYTMGRAYIHRRTREDLLTALHYYEQAIKEDPNYALAYTGLAEAYGNLGVRGYLSPLEGRQKQGEAARKALELDDQLAEAHATMGVYYITFVPYNFSAGESELRRAIEISPNLAIAHLFLGLSLLRHDQLEQGGAEMLKARELDPFSAIIAHQVALYYYLKHDFVRALELIKRADELGPSFTTMAESGIYLQNGAYREALAELDKESQKRKDDPLLISGRGIVYAAQGKRVEAINSIKELEHLSNADFRQAQWIAKIYLILGEREEALTWLQRGVTANSVGGFYKDEPFWNSLRNDSRFTDLLRQMGIP